MDEEPMAEVQLTAECNIFAIGTTQMTTPPEIIVEGRVDQYPETCQVKSPMLDSSPNNQITEYSKLYTARQHGQILNETSNKANIEKEIDVLETMNIELEHSVATLRKENKTLKQHYKDCMILLKSRDLRLQTDNIFAANNAELKLRFRKMWNPLVDIQICLVLGGFPTGKLFDSCTSKVDSEPPHGSNVDIHNIHECKQTLDVSCQSMAAKKADISETIVKVDSQMMIQKNDVCSQQFRPQSSMSNDV
ncbi:hypothetical protein Tco_1274043 [Tanacetum coccineum]